MLKMTARFSMQIFKLSWSPNCRFYFLQKDYKRDLETEIRGKGMQVSTGTLDIQRAKRASEMASQVRNWEDTKFTANISGCIQKKYKACFHLCGLEIQTSKCLHCYRRLRKALKIIFCSFQKEYKKDLENEIKGKGMQVSVDIPDMLRAKRASEIYSQVGREWRCSE